MEKNNLIIISSHYLTFVKDQVEVLSRHFNKIYVFINHNRLAEISKYLPFKGYITHIRRYTVNNLLDLEELPKNVEVHLVSMLYFIPDGSNEALGDKIFKNIDRLIQREGIEFNVVHAHFTWPCGYVGAKLKEKYCVPLIVTAHGYDIYDLPFRSHAWKNKIEYILNSADYIITVSNSNLDCIRKLNIRTPVKVLPNGFNSGVFYQRNAKECKKLLGLPVNKKIILTVGSLEEVKGHRYLIDAIAKIVEQRKDVLCVIVGSGQFKNKMEKLIKKLNLESYIILVGGKPHEEIPLWINSADIFVLSSLREGNPTVMFEALGCGKPFIGTNVGGIPDVIISEDYGLLCNPADPEAFAKNILIALDKKWDEGKIKKYAERFKWENIANEIIQIYEESIKGRKLGL